MNFCWNINLKKHKKLCPNQSFFSYLRSIKQKRDHKASGRESYTQSHAMRSRVKNYTS